MKTTFAAAALAVLAVPAMAQDYNITVTNNMPEGNTIAPIIVVDALLASPIMFNADGTMSDMYRTTVLEGDPRPMKGKIGDGVAGPVLGTAGPPGVLIAGGETATADMFIFANTIRFYAKGSYGPDADTVISGVYDISTGPGTVQLNRYDIGASEGTNEITLVDEGVVTVVIKAN